MCGLMDCSLKSDANGMVVDWLLDVLRGGLRVGSGGGGGMGRCRCFGLFVT